MTGRVFATLAITIGFAASGLAAQPTTPSAGDIPKSARAALNKALPGWRLATPSESPAAPCAPSASTPRDVALAVSADFDGDLRQDRAFYVDVNGTPRLVIVLDRDEEDLVFQLPMASPGIVPLTLRKQGQRYATAYAGADDFLSTDTLALDRCEGGASLFLWRGQSFERYDAPAASPAKTP